MRILGHGVDIAETDRVAQLLQTHGERFLARCFTEAEQAYVAANPKRRAEHLAGRFAAKEAVLKALGTGWAGGILWTDVEVVREKTGRPSVALHGEAARIAEGLGVTDWWLSISHSRAYAVASAIAAGSG